jgi:hypothetical protein
MPNKRKLYKSNTSGVCGVYWNRNTQKWHARIKFRNKDYYLGSWSDFRYAVNMQKKVMDLLDQKELEVLERVNRQQERAASSR